MPHKLARLAHTPSVGHAPLAWPLHKETMHMRTASTLILATLAATALLALASSGASARNLSVNERNFELIWNEALGGTKTRLTFADSFGLLTRCKVTLLGRFVERTIVKQTSTRIAEINHATREECIEGTAVEFSNLPWEVLYRGFTGRLPAIRTLSIGILRLTTRIKEGVFFVECTATTTAAEPAVFILEEIELGVETIRADETARIRLTGANPECERTNSPLNFRERGLVRNLPRTARIALTLI